MWALWLLAVLVLVAFLPVGIVAQYGAKSVSVQLKIGFLRFFLYPRRKRQTVTTNKAKKSNTQPAQSIGKFKDFAPIFKTVLSLIVDLRKRIRINDLQLKLILAGDDPCDLSVNYGRTWAAVGTLQPQLDRYFRIKKQNIDVLCDYTADETMISCSVDASLSVARLLQLVLRYGIRVFKQYSELKNQRKGGTVYESETSSDA